MKRGRRHVGCGYSSERRGWHRFRCYVRARLHRRIFMWFGASILITGVTVLVAFLLVSGREGSAWYRDMQRAQFFIGDRFARVWSDPEQRAELATSVASSFDLSVELQTADRQHIEAFSGGEGECAEAWFVVPVEREGAVIGWVRLSPTSRRPRHAKWPMFLVLIVAGVTLWAASGSIARRIVRPLIELERVARDIGEGKLSSRVAFDDRADEVAVVAEAVNDMAARIEKQLADQRKLLAAVSHEMRTPLGHLRVLVELAREDGTNGNTLDQMDRELIEADALIGELLASSQLEFAALKVMPLDANDVAQQAARRAALPADLVELSDDDVEFEGDPTLLARALANLIDNAQKHGGGATAVRVRRSGTTVVFEVEDDGPGFGGDDPARFFESFSQGGGTTADAEANDTRHASLGLGLALIKRIAVAHHGKAGAENLPDGGARVYLEVAIQRELSPEGTSSQGESV